MAHCNTVLSQFLKWVPRHEFETLAKRHHSGRSFRVALGAVRRPFYGALKAFAVATR